MTKTEEEKKRRVAKFKTISVKFPVSDVGRIPGNASRFFRVAGYKELDRIEKKDWKPKNPYAKKLWAMRQKYIQSGGELLDLDGINREIKERRGGLA